MSDDTNKGSSQGIGFTGLLTITFVALRLTHVIEWSWLWVLSPIWISIAFAILVVTVVCMGIVAVGLFGKR